MGHTDNPKSDSDYTFEALLQHTYGFLNAVGIREAHFAGHSRGGFLVTRLALEYPGLVKTLVLVASGTTARDDPSVPEDTFYKDIERRVPPGPPTPETVRMEPDAQAYRKEQVTDDFLARMLEIALLPKTQEAQKRTKALGPTLWLPSLVAKRQETLRTIDDSGLPVPTLLLWGFNDPAAPLPLGLKLFGRICAKTPEAALHVLNGAAHYSFRDQPQAFNRVLRSFCLR